MSDKLQIFISMACYMLVVIGIGLFFYKRAQKNSSEFFLGGRSLGPWVAAMSAEASDMSGWLLMGLPGVAYWCGLVDAFWTAVGLALGTYFNWLFVAKRLRRYSYVSKNSITVPDFFSNRFHEKSKLLLGVSAIFILVFFTVYASSCLVTCGKLFSTLFDLPYHYMMIAGAVFVLFYTFLGGFLAESVSDFMQAIVMVFALVTVLATGIFAAGGISEVLESAKAIPGFVSLDTMATPLDKVGEAITDAETVQNVVNGAPMFGDAKPYGLLTIISMLAWGLGYFGMPQVLLRFMAIRKPDELKKSRRIATVWVVISLAAAVCLGIIGRALLPTDAVLLTKAGAESVFIRMSEELLPALCAGVVMAGILAATISSSDSYLLIAASAFSKNIYEGILKKNATDKQVMMVSRIILLVISVIGVIIAWNEKSVIFSLVSFAWAGFGATFGPVMIMSLFWKRINRAGALAGMLSGGIMVFVWKLLLNPLGGVFEIYELLPAFIVSLIFIVAVSLLTAPPSKEIVEEFEKVKAPIAEEL